MKTCDRDIESPPDSMSDRFHVRKSIIQGYEIGDNGTVRGVCISSDFLSYEELRLPGHSATIVRKYRIGRDGALTPLDNDQPEIIPHP
jgi:hypothetical protein